MVLRPIILDERERDRFRATIAFLDGRLAERETVNWALRLDHHDSTKRLAVLELINNFSAEKLREPWRAAWRLIEETWRAPQPPERHSGGEYLVQRRLQAGDRSGSLITTLVDLVAPRLLVKPFSDLQLTYRSPRPRPKSIEDLFSVGLTSGEVVDPNEIGLSTLVDVSFLVPLAHALEAVVVNGLDMSRRIGLDGENQLWRLGQLHRAYYVPANERGSNEHEPDEFHVGIAPSVKLLHAVVARLLDLDSDAALEFARRWRLMASPVHMRLWATLARNPRVARATDVADFLLGLNARRFWNLHEFPEVAELRARRYREFEPSQQSALAKRIRKGPPPSHWSRDLPSDKVSGARLYWAVRELRRIELAGSSLQSADKKWLDVRISAFSDLSQAQEVTEGFLGTPKARAVLSIPDSKYDLLEGVGRLDALEGALSTSRGGWKEEDPAERAAGWIREPGNQLKVVADLEGTGDGGAAFAEVWERFGWAHSPPKATGEGAGQRDAAQESRRVISLINTLPATTLHRSINGIAHWISTWERYVVSRPEGFDLWQKLWPIASEATNASHPAESDLEMDTAMQMKEGQGAKDLDTLNTPAGKLVGVFLAACPNLQEARHPFETNSRLRTMRDLIAATPGHSGLIARHRMIEHLSYFLLAAPEWSKQYLVSRVLTNDEEAVTHWRAIARRPLSSDVLQIIGNSMVERATDLRIRRETRRALVFNLVVECLYALRDGRIPAVPHIRVQQMIRSLEDEVRGYAAEAIQLFIRDLSRPHQEDSGTIDRAEDLFRSAGRPFLQQVWPQERSLTTSGVSRSLASLPVVTGDAFPEAVTAIEPFLVPFDTWSMAAYGLYDKVEGKPGLSSIDDEEKGRAFLRLLDLTIGRAEGSVIPNDLADALDQIRRVAPAEVETHVFRRLAAAARRA